MCFYSYVGPIDLCGRRCDNGRGNSVHLVCVLIHRDDDVGHYNGNTRLIYTELHHYVKNKNNRVINWLLHELT